jgi:RHS repeat-associated protein
MYISKDNYYPFGMLMPDRNFNSEGYRFGFNDKENDNEIKGKGNQQDYGMRNYDPRLGKFLSVDPLVKSYPELTPYQFSSNSPIAFIDLDGLERYFFQRHIDAETGEPKISIIGQEDIIEKTYSIEMHSFGGINYPAIVYTTHVNERNEYVTNTIEERPLETVYGVSWQKYDVTTTFSTEVDARKGTNGKQSGLTQHYFLQGLNNVAQEVRENGYSGGSGKRFLLSEDYVVRGGIATSEKIKEASGTHPSGLVGFSAESKTGLSITELSKNLPGNYGKIGVTTVGSVRNAGGDVISTSGTSPNHATVTGLSPDKASNLLNPPVANPSKKKN